MGFILLQSWGEKDTAIVEEIAKLNKVSVEVAKKHYEKMLKGIADEVKSA